MTATEMFEMLDLILGMRLRNVKMNNEGKEWTQEDIDRLRSMYICCGYGITSMALLLERTEEEVIEEIKKIGLYRYNENVN